MKSLNEKIVEKFKSDKTKIFNDVDIFSEEDQWISTGSPHADYSLRTFGYPKGIVEIRGESQSGKTTFSLHAAVQCQLQFGDRAVVTFLSSERRDNKPYAKKIGLDVDNCIVHRVVTIEDVFNKIQQTVKFATDEFAKSEIGKPRFLFIWDSLGQTISAQEKRRMDKRADEDGEGAAAMGAAARALSMGLRYVVGLSDDYDITLMIINRPYDKVDGVPGKVSYGGKAIMLFPTMRLDLARIEGIKAGDEEIGQVTKVTVIKSDFSRPKISFKVEIFYGVGIVLGKEEMALAMDNEIIEKHHHGGKFLNGKMVWQSKSSLFDLYNEKNALLGLLRKRIYKVYREKFLEERKAEHE